MKRTLVAILATAALSAISGCAGHYPPPSISEIGTAKHHVNSGMMLLEKGKIPDAMWQFDRAVELDSTMAMGYVGRALAHLVYNDLKRCKSNLDFARSVARGDEDWINIYTGYMRLYTAQKQEGWLDEVKGNFKRALDIDPRYKPAFFYMGMAYKEDFDFKAAELMFERVLEINDPFLIKADSQWKLIRQILNAQPRSHLAKTVALQQGVSRAQLAGLLVKELDLDAMIHEGYIKKEESKAPRQVSVSDIQSHILKADIEAVLAVSLEGLSLKPNNLFHPDELVSRGDVAAIIEDLMKKSGEDVFQWQPKVSASPFRDMPATHPRFKAALYCVTRGFMNIHDISTEEFAPELSVSGTDTLIAIRKMRDMLRYR